VTIPIRLVLYTIYISPIASLPQPFSHPTQSNCKKIFVLFSQVCEVHQTYISLISFLHPPHSHYAPCPAHTVPILQSWFSLLTFKLAFKGVSQCMPYVGVLYFELFNSINCPPLSLYLPPSLFNSFQYTSLSIFNFLN
jgi:hypothetical protein